MDLKDIFNRFGRKPVNSDEPHWRQFTMPEQVKAAVAKRLAECRDIEAQIDALRTRKRMLSLEISAMENAALAERPVNPKGAQNVGG